jgi:hypothetical protein
MRISEEPRLRPGASQKSAGRAATSIKIWLPALATVALALAAWNATPFFIQSTDHAFSDDIFCLRAMFKLSVLIVASLISAYLLIPSLTVAIEPIRRRWRRGYTALALAAVCIFQWLFVIHAGRWQFGAFDYSNLMQEGWREALGQRPYVDFLASTPPAFNLGIKLAFQLFGVNWDANLYFTAIFTCATFLWIDWLLTRLSLTRLASMATAFAIESAAMLTLSFWWYNNVTTILAAVLFLSTLLYAKEQRSIPAQFSYVASLAVTSLTKPNIAGLTIAGCVVLLMIVSERRLQTAVLTLGGVCVAVALLLLNHVSIPALLRAYRAVAGERGFGSIGFNQLNDYDQYSSLCWIPILSLPLFALLPRIKSQLQAKQWRNASFSLSLFLAPLIAAYGLATNGELWQVECTLLLGASAVAAFGMRPGRPIVRRIYIAFLASFIAGNLYIGAERIRIYDIGPHMFFEWQDNRNLIDRGFLKNMRVSSTMIGVERQIDLAVRENPGPYWFGPRLDFSNAVLQLPMPDHLAAWWHPGTAFARSDVPGLLQLWQQQRFRTLIFLNRKQIDGYTYYPQELLDLIQRDYVADHRYPLLTVYHLRAGADPQR